MMNREEELFKLQVFQQTISTLYMYPLRIYKNDCYEKFQEEILEDQEIEKFHKILLPNQTFDGDTLIETLQKKLKDDPRNIDIRVYEFLESHVETLRKIMWKTHASNSLTFTREIKGDRRLWVFLLVYDLFPKAFIDKYFEKPYMRECLINMQSIYVKINEHYTLSIGRLFTENQESEAVVKSVIRDYGFEKMNIFELITLAKKRRTFNRGRLEKKSLQIKEAFRLFLESYSQLPINIHKEELEKVALFIYMVTKDEKVKKLSLRTKNLKLNYLNGKLQILSISQKVNDLEVLEDAQLLFESNRDYFRGEYASRLKSSLAKKYSGLIGIDSYSPIEDLLKHILNKLLASGACFVKYNLADNKLKLVAKAGDDAYKVGIERIVGQINRKEPHTLKKSRVLRIIKNYYTDAYKYDIEKLILQNLNPKSILQPVKGKPILSNLAIPITLQHKLLGVLLIDSFRVGSFSEDDLNLIFSISNALSIQIFDQIIEKNLSSIMEHLPEKAELDDKRIEQYFQDLTTDINNIFFSYGVAIWEYDEEKVFTLKSTTLDVHSITPITIAYENGELISDIVDKFEMEGFKYAHSYDIKNFTRLKSCNPIQYNERINCLRIYPIVRAGKLMGAFSIYNHSEDDYKAIDRQSLDIVKRHLTIFFNTIEVMKAQRALTKAEALHEIHARFNMVEDKTKQLRKLVNVDFKELDHYARYRFGIKLDDINNLISNTRIAFKYITNSSKAIRHTNHVDDEVENMYRPLQDLNIETNNLRYIFNELTNSIPKPYSRKNIRINNTINEKINLLINNLILKDIFQNLLLNAIKYSFQGTAIRIYSKEKSNSIRIFIKNDGLPIRGNEEIDIFKYGYRGFSTKDYKEDIHGETISYERKNSENLGIGLYKVHELIKKILGGEICLTRQNSSIQGAETNTFEIILPKQLLKREENE